MFYVNLADLVYWVGIDRFDATEQNYNFAVFMFVRVYFFGDNVCVILVFGAEMKCVEAYGCIRMHGGCI